MRGTLELGDLVRGCGPETFIATSIRLRGRSCAHLRAVDAGSIAALLKATTLNRYKLPCRRRRVDLGCGHPILVGTVQDLAEIVMLRTARTVKSSCGGFNSE